MASKARKRDSAKPNRARKSMTAAQTSKTAKAHKSRKDHPDSAELELLRLMRQLSNQFREGKDPEKVFRSALKMAVGYFAAASGSLMEFQLGTDVVVPAYCLGESCSWDEMLVAGFLRGEEVEVPANWMLARIRRRGRMWGALVLQRGQGEFAWDDRRAFSTLANTATELAEQIDQARVREVRERIERKIMVQIRPKDLCYQLLHAVRSLTSYDHSASVLTCDSNTRELEIVAEQVAWHKGKSDQVGRRFSLTNDQYEILLSGQVLGLDRIDGSWQDWTKCEGELLSRLLDYNARVSGNRPVRAEGAMICAPLTTQNRVLGVLKIAATRAGTFRDYEVELISRFLPYALIALQNSQRTESLQQQVLASERKNAMADLARGVSHDVNNALGAVLPLVQQLRAELQEDDFDPKEASADLKEIERSVQVCRRIFGGMLKFARNATQPVGDVDIRHALDGTLGILREGMNQRQIQVDVQVEAGIPRVRAALSDAEQVLLNVLSNARDAMPDGGSLSIRVSPSDGDCQMQIADTGCGISARHLKKIEQPFFTTKQSGNGLGLAICRSIVSEMRGRMSIQSHLGEGTQVTLVLPGKAMKA